MPPRKTSRQTLCVPVPTTDTGGQVENTEVSELTIVKELGKFAP
jgi:hypothetical protein